MNTRFYLMAQYDGAAVVPIERVCADYFSHLSPAQLARKIAIGEIKLPLVRMEASQKSAKGVYVEDLAQWIDARRAAAQKELKQMAG
jgi:hypothetical protein